MNTFLFAFKKVVALVVVKSQSVVKLNLVLQSLQHLIVPFGETENTLVLDIVKVL